MLRNYLKIIFRSLVANYVHGGINIIGLAVGMAACLFIFQYVNFERSYDGFHPNLKQLYRVTGYDNASQSGSANTFLSVAPILAAEVPEVDKTLRIFESGGLITVNTDEGELALKEENTIYADPTLLNMFGFKLLSGSRKASLSKSNSVLLTSSSAKKYFGDKDPIGQTLSRYDMFGEQLFEITAVIEDIPGNSHLGFDMAFSWDNIENNYQKYNMEGWNAFYTYVTIKDGADISGFVPKTREIAKKYLGEDSKSEMRLQPVRDIYLGDNLGSDFIRSGSQARINLLATIAILILVIAWVNYINLSVSRSMERAKEVGVRKSLGSKKTQLIGLFVLESFVINIIAAGLAITLFQVLVPYFKAFSGIDLSPSSYWDYNNIWLYFGAIFMLGALLSSVYPALVMSAYQPSKVLKGSISESGRRVTLRKGLVVFQFAVSVVLIAGTLAVFFQVRYMLNNVEGVNVDQVVIIETPSRIEGQPGDRIATYQDYLKQFTAATDVMSAGIAPAINFNYGISTWLPGQSRLQEGKSARFGEVDDRYFDFYELEFVAGQNFKENVADLNKKIILNESAANQLGFWNYQEAIGKEILAGNSSEPLEIWGIIKDYNHFSLRDAINPAVYGYEKNNNLIAVRLFADKDNKNVRSDFLDYAEARFLESFPGNPFEYIFLDEAYSNAYEADLRFGEIFTVFSLLTIFIACFGLFGLVSYSASRRTKEIGIRKVLGASVLAIYNMFSKEFILLVIISNFVALPIAYFLTKEWLANYAFQTSLGWWFYAIPALAVTMIALLIISIKTVRTATTNPVDALRYE
ncbi:MAG: ABC transporter permease [Bacteroidota bacterium]